MRARLVSHGGVLYVLRRERGPRIEAFDWDGRRLGPGFAIEAAGTHGSDARGLAVDGDHRLWIADRAARALRAFSVFGVEVRRVEARPAARDDAPGNLAELGALAARGVEHELVLLAASAGERRHALHLLGPAGEPLDSPRPLGDPRQRFHGIADLCLQGRLAWVAEEPAGRVQLFRDGEFHFALRLEAGFRPRAIAPLEDGRLLAVEATGGLQLFDGGGRRIAELAAAGEAEGSVHEACSLAVEEGEDERHTRVAVLDLGGDRAQVFALDGRCFGSFPELRGATL